MDKSLRLETELRLLVTAAATEDGDLREKILDFGYFETQYAKRIQDVFIAEYLKNPDCDYSAMMLKLDRDDQILMIDLMQTAISQEIEEKRVDGTLETLRSMSIDDRLYQKVSELTIKGGITPDELRRIADEADNIPACIIDSADRYLREYETPIKLISTGYGILDTMLGGGLASGTISALGARPSVGKTTFAINMVTKNPNVKTMFFSLEMSARTVYDKIVSDIGNLNYADCVRHNINMDTVRSIVGNFGNLIVIDDVYDIETIASLIRQHKPELVIIDYIQIVQTSREIDIPRQRIDHIAGVIKRTAKATGAHIMSLSQITRGAKEEPTMSALKESGGLEETGDYVLLLKRPYVLDKSDERLKPEETELKIDKNKFGKSGLLEFFFDGGHQRFLEVGYMSDKKSGHEKDEQIARMKKEKANEQGDIDDLPF